MIQSLVQYFIQNDHLDLPNVGSLKWSKQEAFWKDGILFAPKEQIIFDPIDNKPSKQFYNFLADNLGISTDQAIIKFEDFVSNFSNQTVAELVFGNLGTLCKNSSHITWNNSYDDSHYHKNLDLTHSLIQDNNTQVTNFRTNDKWWIWALIITTIATSLIIFKLF
jgi:hypothetical protein